MKIVYIHHAHRNMQTGANQENAITDYGKIEAENLGEMLKNFAVKAIYSGDYIRYHQTVELINKHIKATVYSDSRLNEWVSNAESKESFTNRTYEFLNSIIEKHENEDTVFCVTSGVQLGEFVSFFNNCRPVKGFEIMQAVGICPVIFHYNKITGGRK